MCGWQKLLKVMPTAVLGLFSLPTPHQLQCEQTLPPPSTTTGQTTPLHFPLWPPNPSETKAKGKFSSPQLSYSCRAFYHHGDKSSELS